MQAKMRRLSRRSFLESTAPPVVLGAAVLVVSNCEETPPGPSSLEKPFSGPPLPEWSSPCVADGKVLFGSYDRDLYLLDARTGKLIWK